MNSIVINIILKVQDEIIGSCSGILGSGVIDILKSVYNGMLFAVPVLVVVLSIKDLLTASTASKEDEMKKAQSTMIKRIVIGLIVLFVPILVSYIVKLVGVGNC